VAKKKHHVAPFEIVAGLGKNPPLQEGADEESPTPPEVPPQPEQKPRRHVGSGSAGTPMASTYHSASPVTEQAEPGKLTVSIGHLTAGLVIGAVILLVAGAFVLGRMTAGPSEATSAGVTDGANKAPERLTGKYYMVIEALDFSAAGREKAEHIVYFLQQQGVETSVERYRYPEQRRGRSWVVLSYKGFPNPADPAARRFAERMAKLGEEYSKRYSGNFEFSPKKYPDSQSPWFEVWK
jgi:hypothetical protein